MEILALEFKTITTKYLYINPKRFNDKFHEINNYINIYKCHTK